jgi:hypothetical protein
MDQLAGRRCRPTPPARTGPARRPGPLPPMPCPAVPRQICRAAVKLGMGARLDRRAKGGRSVDRLSLRHGSIVPPRQQHLPSTVQEYGPCSSDPAAALTECYRALRGGWMWCQRNASSELSRNRRAVVCDAQEAGFDPLEHSSFKRREIALRYKRLYNAGTALKRRDEITVAPAVFYWIEHSTSRIDLRRFNRPSIAANSVIVRKRYAEVTTLRCLERWSGKQPTGVRSAYPEQR